MTRSARWLWLEQEWRELLPLAVPQTCQNVSRVTRGQPLFACHAVSVGLRLPTHGSAVLGWLL